MAQFVDKSLWKREDKWLVYDGQQRLQTLFSCLKYTLNGRILTYNLFFNLENNDDTEACGFEFVTKNSTLKPGVIAMPQLFIQPEDGKVKYRKELQNSIPADLMAGNEEMFENIIDKLWDVFIRKDVISLAFFPIDKSWGEQYDFVPDDINNVLWTDHKIFIEYRKQKMIDFMLSKYGIEIRA